MVARFLFVVLLFFITLSNVYSMGWGGLGYSNGQLYMGGRPYYPGGYNRGYGYGYGNYGYSYGNYGYGYGR
ncbi:hypothetical protein QR680_015557 [Steinernema hermaphroditum]|uniref:Uncharacterized protein n=1 Tax=Steinernema hermaphroditum TaxID=289476 RepID=A0AA39H8H3_9BILA|nr:hypothetical protein QR680_015557 [Steinernema hermaphroditum]